MDESSSVGSMAVSVTASSISSSTIKCRICWMRNEHKSSDLIKPCYCKGSVAQVHLQCLQKWLEESGIDYCEVCYYRYEINTRPKYGMCYSVIPFFGQAENRRKFRDLYGVVPGMTFLVFLACCCCMLAIFILEDIKSEMLSHTYVTFKTILTVCLACILIVYAAMLYSITEELIEIWRKWRSRQLSVVLVLPGGSSNKKKESKDKSAEEHPGSDEPDQDVTIPLQEILPVRLQVTNEVEGARTHETAL